MLAVVHTWRPANQKPLKCNASLLLKCMHEPVTPSHRSVLQCSLGMYIGTHVYEHADSCCPTGLIAIIMTLCDCSQKYAGQNENMHATPSLAKSCGVAVVSCAHECVTPCTEQATLLSCCLICCTHQRHCQHICADVSQLEATNCYNKPGLSGNKLQRLNAERTKKLCLTSLT